MFIQFIYCYKMLTWQFKTNYCKAKTLDKNNTVTNLVSGYIYMMLTNLLQFDSLFCLVNTSVVLAKSGGLGHIDRVVEVLLRSEWRWIVAACVTSATCSKVKRSTFVPDCCTATDDVDRAWDRVKGREEGQEKEGAQCSEASGCSGMATSHFVESEIMKCVAFLWA